MEETKNIHKDLSESEISESYDHGISVDAWANRLIKDIQDYVLFIKEEEELAEHMPRDEQDWWDDFMVYMVEGKDEWR